MQWEGREGHESRERAGSLSSFPKFSKRSDLWEASSGSSCMHVLPSHGQTTQVGPHGVGVRGGGRGGSWGGGVSRLGRWILSSGGQAGVPHEQLNDVPKVEGKATHGEERAWSRPRGQRGGRGGLPGLRPGSGPVLKSAGGDREGRIHWAGSVEPLVDALGTFRKFPEP